VSALYHFQSEDLPTVHPAVGVQVWYSSVLPVRPHKRTAKLVDTGELLPSLNYRRIAKINLAFMPTNGILKIASSLS